jgi:hypothetical protein
MNLPFTTEQFFDVFVQYNNSVFPLQIIFVLAALSILFIIFKRSVKLYPLVWVFLAVFWAWIGIVYHIRFFSPINPIAKGFGVLFMIEAALFIYFGTIKKGVEFDLENNIGKNLGIFLFLYSLLLYPLITIGTGHGYPALPTFGVPCPTTIFTIGILLLTNLNKTPKTLLIVPILWTFIATTAALKLEVYADILLIVSSMLLGASLLTSKSKKETINS